MPGDFPGGGGWAVLELTGTLLQTSAICFGEYPGLVSSPLMCRSSFSLALYNSDCESWIFVICKFNMQRMLT